MMAEEIDGLYRFRALGDGQLTRSWRRKTGRFIYIWCCAVVVCSATWLKLLTERFVGRVTKMRTQLDLMVLLGAIGGTRIVGGRGRGGYNGDSTSSGGTQRNLGDGR